jgi:DNA-binding MarR family transcriptional regulator
MKPPKDTLSPVQARVIRFISATIRAEGKGPTIRAICREIGVTSTNGVMEHLDALEYKGFITRPKIALTDQARKYLHQENAAGHWTNIKPAPGDGKWYKILEWFEDRWIFGFFDNLEGTEAADWVDIAYVWSEPEVIPEFPSPEGMEP